MTLLEFYKNYVIVNGKSPIISDYDKWLLENLDNGRIERVWTRRYGYQYKSKQIKL